MLHQHHSNGVIHAPTAMCIEFYSRSYLGQGGRKGSHPYTPCCFSESANDSKSPTYERSGCELSKMRTCIRTSSHRSPCVWHALSQACNTYKCLCFCVLYDIVSSTVLQYYCSIITVVLLQYYYSITAKYYSSTLYYFSKYSTERLKIFYFLCLFFMYYLCEKYYKPIIVQY